MLYTVYLWRWLFLGFFSSFYLFIVRSVIRRPVANTIARLFLNGCKNHVTSRISKSPFLTPKRLLLEWYIFFIFFYFSKCKHILLTHYLLSPHPVNYAEMLIHMRDECLKCVRNCYNFLIVSKSSIQLTMKNWIKTY